MPWETILIIAVLAGAVVPAVGVWWWYCDTVHVRVQTGVNDDNAAVAMFIRVLNAATKTLVIHDDGNKMEGTVYKDERVVDAVRHRLREHSALSIHCFFNDREEDLDLVRHMRSEFPDRFKVCYRKAQRPAGDIHYKIADGGVLGHISTHEHGQPERAFKLLDCSATRDRTKKIAFGRYLAQLKREVGKATA